MEEMYDHYKVRMGDPIEDWMRNKAETPKDMLDDPRVWIHEFIELSVEWLLHSKFHADSESKYAGPPSDYFPELSYRLFTGTHRVSHIMTAMFTISGYGMQIIEPEEYVLLLPWDKWKRRLEKSKSLDSGIYLQVQTMEEKEKPKESVAEEEAKEEPAEEKEEEKPEE